MSRHPVVVPTTYGNHVAVVHEPDGAARAAVVTMAGDDGRAGANRGWARVADALAAVGLVTLRFDYRLPGVPLDDPSPHAQAFYDAVDWFRERTSDLDFLLIARCAGAERCLTYASRAPDIAGVGLIVPWLKSHRQRDRFGAILRPVDRTLRSRLVPSWLDRDRVGALLKRSPRISQLLLRSTDQGRVDTTVAGLAARVAERVPVWVLLGERDHEWRSLQASPDKLPGATIDVVPGLQLHRYGNLTVQRTVVERVAAWADQTIRERSQT